MGVRRAFVKQIVKIAAAFIPAFGTYFAIANQTYFVIANHTLLCYGNHLIAFIVAAIQIVAVLLGLQFVSKITVPQAFALGYVFSFLEPTVSAAAGPGARIRYTTREGQSITRTLENVDVQFQVVLPEDLDLVGDKSTPSGLSKVFRRVDTGYTRGELLVDNEAKGFGVHLNMTNPQQPVVVDVPNNLNALRALLVREAGDAEASKLEERAKKALAEYVENLKKSCLEQSVRWKDRVTIINASDFLRR